MADETTWRKLAALRPLNSDQGTDRACKICGATARMFDVVDFLKMCDQINPYPFGLAGVPVYYYRCGDCQFLFTDFFDGWSNEDFARYIYNDDYIKVDGEYAGVRPRRDGAFFADLLRSYAGLAVLDYGGGTGLLAGVLRDSGFDAECYDPFSSPGRPVRKFDVITCMEVIEHVCDPVAAVRDMASLLNPGGCILVGTGLQPDDIDRVRTNWWYVAPRNGHVSLQSSASLLPLARAAGLVAYRSEYLHGFAAAPSHVSEAILSTIGQPAVDLLLLAPDRGAAAGSMLSCDLGHWHALEPSGLRWTARDEISWRWAPPLANCDVQLRLPLILEIEGDFLSRSRLLIDDSEVPLRRTAQGAAASAALHGAASVSIRLITPAPLSPRMLYGNDDDRLLGVALPAYDANAPLRAG